MKSLSTDTIIHYFDPKNETVLEVESGEVIEVDTLDCYGEQIYDETILRSDIDPTIINGATGPIYIEGAEAGDTLCIEILSIKTENQGLMVGKPGMGVLGDSVEIMDTKILKIEDGRVRFNDNILLPLKPMIGVIGLAPAKEKIHCSLPGAHGGNLDTKEIKAGSKLYLPVSVPGAQLAIGDLHAIMGDGELSGNGVEVSGSVVVRPSVIKDTVITSPVIETASEIIFINTGEFKVAAEACTMRATKYVQGIFDLVFNEAYRLVSATCDLAISQVVNGPITTKLKLPRYVINWKGFI